MGSYDEEDRFPCRNCDGRGSTGSGRGQRITCGECRGEGEKVVKKKVECPDCGGTGKNKAIQEAEQPQVVGKPNQQEKQQVAPSAGRVSPPPIMQDEEQGQPRPKAKAKGKAKKGPALSFGRHGEINWDEEAGLLINLTLGKVCLLSSCGSLFLFLGFALIAKKELGWTMLGGAIAVCGSGCVLKGNLQRCVNLMQALKPPTPKGSALARGP